MTVAGAGAPTGEGGAIPRLPYWPALDGLRAIAVLLVFSSHVTGIRGFGQALRGGSFGVDVFFVISGFLITSLLVSERAARGGINLGAFWVRRARRLLPALFLTIVGVCLIAQFSAPGSIRLLIRNDALGTLFFVQNWREIHIDRPSPLGHTWSLSVEEQWYLVWPVVLALGYGVFGWTRRKMAAIAAVLGIASAIWMVVAFETIGGYRAYFGTDTRAFQLLAGATLACARDPERRPGSTRRVDRIALMATGGLMLAVFGYSSFVSQRLFGFFVVTASAAALVFVATAVEDTTAKRLLSSPPLVAIGLASYGIYLFHIPILWWIRLRFDLGAIAVAVLAATMTGIAAFASLRFVERPVRSPTRSPRVLAIGCAFAFVALTGLVLAATRTSGRVSPVRAVTAFPPAAGDALRALAASAPEASRVLVVGDTNAVVLGFDGGSVSTPDVVGASFGIYGCGLVALDPIVGVGGDADDDTAQSGCEAAVDAHLAAIAVFEPDIVVVMVGTTEGFGRLLEGSELEPRSRDLARRVEGDIGGSMRELSEGRHRTVMLTAPCGVVERSWTNERIQRALRLQSELVAIDYGAWLCPDNEARIDADGTPFVFGGRLTIAGAKATWPWLLNELRSRNLLAGHAADG